MCRGGNRAMRRLAALALALVAVAGCRTVREEVQPLRETTLTVARAGGDRSASVNRAEYRADQARQCLAALARAAQERRA